MERREALEHRAPAALDHLLHLADPHAPEGAVLGDPLELCLVVPAEGNVTYVRLAVPAVLQELVSLAQGEQSEGGLREKGMAIRLELAECAGASRKYLYLKCSLRLTSSSPRREFESPYWGPRMGPLSSIFHGGISWTSLSPHMS